MTEALDTLLDKGGLKEDRERERRIPGYHCEWNLGSPGGWLYQQMAQDLGEMAWQRLSPYLNLPFKLDFRSPHFHPVPRFADMLLRAHRQRHGSASPYIALLAEIDTLESVVENRLFVDYLNTLDGVYAALAAPEHLELRQGRVRLNGRPVSIFYMDFNNDTLLKMGELIDIDPVKAAIHQKLVVNPRGMEPVGVKGVFEAICGSHRHLMSDSTVRRTPWTRVFRPRRTTGPQGENIPDLVEWTRLNFSRLILKPSQGYSGYGIQVGGLHDPQAAVDTALAKGGYIVQDLVPLDTWQEYYPHLAGAPLRVQIEPRQTDFRCLISDAGLMGFLARFGGVPTNVGSGGGAQALAVVQGDLTLAEADRLANGALEGVPAEVFQEVAEAVRERSLELGFTYLPGPIPTSLKPRMLKPAHLFGLAHYARNLWKDAVILEKLWRQGRLDDVAPISPQEKELALMAPWDGQPALMASDGLYNFRGAGF
jgi:hypothetical protein